MSPRACLFALVLGAVVLGGCYQTPKPDCGFTCGAGGACPTDYTCHEDNRCRPTSLGSAPCQEVFEARGNDPRPRGRGPGPRGGAPPGAPPRATNPRGDPGRGASPPPTGPPKKAPRHGRSP